jgi:hypothetical protein
VLPHRGLDDRLIAFAADQHGRKLPGQGSGSLGSGDAPFHEGVQLSDPGPRHDHPRAGEEPVDFDLQGKADPEREEQRVRVEEDDRRGRPSRTATVCGGRS